MVWNKNTVDTSKVGSIKYQGKIEQYDRTAELNLKVIKAEKAKKIGGISKVYEDNGKRYLSFDEGNVNGRLTDGYYIRNKDKRLKTYEISPNAHISVCGFSVNLDTVNQQKISYEKFKTVDMGDRPRYRGVLCHIYLENNVVVKIEQQYIP